MEESSMEKDKESSSSSEVPEEEEEVQSEHGSTTDAENEEVYYWESLLCGILAFPAPLRLQSLLFIIGHLEEYENETLALLPPRTRRELLLNLPVVDVCRLEGSGVTEDIDMEEVWKTLYYNRLPTHQERFETYLTTIDEVEETGANPSWKDCYFSTVFYTRMGRPYDEDCSCAYSVHLQQDLLYGMYTYNGTLELQKCFGPRCGSCFQVETYARQCSRLTPSRYISEFPNPMYTALRRGYNSPPKTICATIPTLVDVCKFNPTSFSASDASLSDFGDDCFTDDFFPYWKSFLGNVRSLRIAQLQRTELHSGWKHIMDAIFCSAHCKLNELYIDVSQNHYFDDHPSPEINELIAFLVPYFSPTPSSNTSAVQYAHLKKMHIVGGIKTVTDALNIQMIFNHQQDLQVVTFDPRFSSETPDAHLTLPLTTLFKKSSFQKLTLSTASVSTSLVLKVLHEFFSSQSTNHQELCFDHVRVMPDKPAKVTSTPPPEVVGSKSLEIIQCVLQPEIASIFPPSVSFRKLTIDAGYGHLNLHEYIGTRKFMVLDLFSHVQSLQVENMSLTVRTTNQNSKAVVNLLNLVETPNWSLHFQFISSSQQISIGLPENTDTLVDAVTDVTPTLSWLVRKGAVTCLCFHFASPNGLPEPVFEALLEEVFNGIQHSRSKIELDFRDGQLTCTSLECLYRTWNRCTDMKLKKLDVTRNELPLDISNLQQMTDELIHDS